MTIKQRVVSGFRYAGKKGARATIVMGRHLPDGVKQFAKSTARALPDNRVTRRVRRALSEATNAAPLIGESVSRGHMLPLRAAGSTYTDEQISTYLQYELSYLKQAYFEVAEERAREAACLPVSPEASASAQELVDQYLQTFESNHQNKVRHLVVVEVYPRIGAEYGNGFVHRRVKFYQAGGAEVHVAVVSRKAQPEIFEYDGVRVIAGSGAELNHLLAQQKYTSISTHFLSEYMWSQLAGNLDGQQLYCYIHGFEARRWVRSLHNYRSSDVLERELATSLNRQQFWRRVVNHSQAPAKYIFVSNWWKNAAQEDLELTLADRKVEVIHNLVDTNLFRYIEKDPAQRFKILWVRTANNFNYGSDIAVRVLKMLRETPYWPKLQVKIVGDGRYFGEFENTFSDDENVEIQRGFITQDEIAKLHREYGLFLVPTRLDTQGVSRDEAMASGLVPITNSVAAVPEFVDGSVAVLAGEEDIEGMVSGVIGLLKKPGRFLEMSRRAAERVSAQSGPDRTVAKEMVLMDLPLPEGDLGHKETP